MKPRARSPDLVFVFNKLFAAKFHLQDNLQNAMNWRNLVKHNPRCLYDNRCWIHGERNALQKRDGLRDNKRTHMCVSENVFTYTSALCIIWTWSIVLLITKQKKFVPQRSARSFGKNLWSRLIFLRTNLRRRSMCPRPGYRICFIIGGRSRRILLCG